MKSRDRRKYGRQAGIVLVLLGAWEVAGLAGVYIAGGALLLAFTWGPARDSRTVIGRR